MTSDNFWHVQQKLMGNLKPVPTPCLVHTASLSVLYAMFVYAYGTSNFESNRCDCMCSHHLNRKMSEFAIALPSIPQSNYSFTPWFTFAFDLLRTFVPNRVTSINKWFGAATMRRHGLHTNSKHTFDKCHFPKIKLTTFSTEFIVWLHKLNDYQASVRLSCATSTSFSLSLSINCTW